VGGVRELMIPGGKQKILEQNQEYKEQVKPSLLDFLFTLALTIGIAPELVGRDGMASYDWVLSVPDLNFLVTLGSFALGISTLLFSWYGFNFSISNKPVLYGSVAGMFRFFLDAFLIVLYGFMLIMFKRLDVVVVLLTMIFVLYSIWDLLKLIEYREEPFDFTINFDSDSITIVTICSEIKTNLSMWDILETLHKRKSAVYLIPIAIISWFQLSSVLADFTTWKDLSTIILLLVITLIYRIDKVKWKVRGEQEKIDRVKNDESVQYRS